MNHDSDTMTTLRLTALTDVQMRRSVYASALLAMLLPPFLGGSLMGLMGFYPLPEFYLALANYRLILYVSIALLMGLAWAARTARFITALTQMDRARARIAARKRFSRSPWILLASVTLYSIGGALTTDFTLEAMGVRDYSVRDHFYNQIGLVPVVLVTVFPIFFFFVDRLGRYLGPRGIAVAATPLWVKLLMLGLVTPLLIDSLLIGYYINHTGWFNWQTMALWSALAAMAAAGTWLAWRSFRQGLSPLQSFIDTQDGTLLERARNLLTPMSMDEMGVLTARYADLLTARDRLSGELKQTQALADSVIEHAGALVLVLDREGRIRRFNRASEKLSGYAFAEVEGKFPWETVLPPEDADTIRREAFESLARGRETSSGFYTNYWLGKDGKRCLIEWSNTLLFDSENEMTFMISVGADITERVEVMEVLKRSERSLRQINESLESKVQERTQALAEAAELNEQILSASSLGISAFHHTGRCVFANEATALAVGARREQILATNFRELESWRQYGLLEAADAVLASGIPATRQLHMITGFGKSAWLDCFLARFMRAGEPHLLIMANDISDRKLAEAELQKQNYRTHQILATALDGFISVDTAGRVVGTNPAFRNMVGYTETELLKMTIADLDANENPEEIAAHIQKVMARGHDRFDTRHRHKDGHLVDIEFSVTLVEMAGEKLFYAFARDISQRKHAEQLVKQAFDRLNAAQRLALLGDYAFDTRTQTLVWSDTVFKLLGLAPGSIVPTPELSLAPVHHEDRPEVERQLGAALSRKHVAGTDGQARLPVLEYRVIHPDDSIHWLHSEAVAEIDESGRAVRIIGTVQDITARKLAEGDLIRAKDEAERANRAKNEFLSRMSHELRTPMNAIIGFAQILETEKLDDELLDYAHEIHRAGDHLLELINELLDLSRIESGKLAMDIRPTPLQPLMAQALSLVQGLAAGHEVTFLNHCNEQVMVEVDETRLRQILVNLMSNAIKYNPRGGRVTLSCREADNHRLRLIVTDTGQGIAPEKLRDLFKPFERLGAEFSGTDGTGIGLALSKRLSESMNSILGVDSTPGQGSSFWIEVPNAATAALRPAPMAEASAADSGPALQTVLCIEDNPANLKLVEAMLRNQPSLKLLTATTGEFGIELARRHRPDAILLDIHLPGVSGYAVLNALRADSSTQSIPVIALSADAMPLDIEKGINAGFADYLTKPVKIETLSKALRKVLGQH